MNSNTLQANRLARLAITFSLLLCAFALTASRAEASPGALNIVVIHSMCYATTDANLVAGMQAEPGVASVTQIKSEHIDDPGGNGLTPTAADLASADAVVMKNDCRWADSDALGNLIADFQDRGGIVFADTWNFWDPNVDAGYVLAGRWGSGGYGPFLPFVSGTPFTQTVAAFDTAHPFFSGVGTFKSVFTYDNTALSDGAARLASWANGSVALAVKGRAVAFNGFLSDDVQSYGDYGRLVVNTIKSLGPRAVSVSLAGNGKGTVTSSAGTLACAATCTGSFYAGQAMVLHASHAPGSVFTGWSGACTGLFACTYTVGYPGATASQWNNAPVTANFALTALKFGKFKKGKLSVTVPGPGKLEVKASGIKTIKKTVTKSGVAKLTLKATGKLKKKLAAGKTAKVKFKFAFTPTGAVGATRTSKSIKLKE